MTTLLTGTVTFLFTDIEGSTRLLKRLGKRYGEALADHRKILRRAARAHAGEEVDNQGDSFLFAFSRADQAAGAAIDAQRALAKWRTPKGPVKNRDLWERLFALVEDDARDVAFVWVKGHRNEANNNIVDRLSRAASKSHAET